jgi:transcriptional regulator with XRE-family HTH domain
MAEIGITPEACLAARGLLKWSVRELGERSGIHWTTVSAFENGRGLRASSAAKLILAFSQEGVEIVHSEDRTGAVLVFAKRPANDQGAPR